jgi:hypothetical protein
LQAKGKELASIVMMMEEEEEEEEEEEAEDIVSRILLPLPVTSRSDVDPHESVLLSVTSGAIVSTNRHREGAELVRSVGFAFGQAG